jgi:hypothetical protein
MITKLFPVFKYFQPATTARASGITCRKAEKPQISKENDNRAARPVHRREQFTE